MKKIIAFIIASFMIISAFTGCELNDTELLHSRFEIVEKNYGNYVDTLYVDKETGVMYWHRSGQGLTPLLDSDGKPLIYKEGTK